MITRYEISEMVRESILKKYLGKPYPCDSANVIVDARVNINDVEEHYDDYGMSSYDVITIEVKTESPVAKRKKWVRVYL